MSLYYSDDFVTLHHGDCREVIDGMADSSVAAVITDPPYSDKTHESTRTNNTANGRRGNRVLSGNFGFDSVTGADLRPLFSRLGAISQGWVVANMDYKHAFEFDQEEPDGLRLLRVGVWVKTNPNPQISGDRPAQGWEAIAYMHRKDKRPAWSGGGKAGNFISPSAQGTGHPTAKPLGMVGQWVRWFTKPGETIFDPFAGSGTTLVAAKQEGRKVIGVELEERYCEIIAKRCAQDVLDIFGGAA